MRNHIFRRAGIGIGLPGSLASRPRLRVALRGVAFVATGLLGGCNWVLFDPKGDIGLQERNLILIASCLMLLVVVPVILLTLIFAWRYRSSRGANSSAVYAPTWAHSTAIEVVVWTIPCLIVIALAALIWRSTHTLDPYRPLASQERPVRVEVVALNWKWLFIYPDYGVASVNQLAIPVDTPIDFTLTSESLMNSFFIPQLGSQVYAMAGMQTQLHLIANEPGVYQGRSSAFSGPGFSDMHFDTLAMSRGAFDAWVARARQSPLSLTRAAWQVLRQPSDKSPVAIYASVEPGLFDRIVAQYVPDTARNPTCGTDAPAVSQEHAGAHPRAAMAAE